MSTMDYLEFKNYLEHGLFDKKKKQYYKTEATTAVKFPVGTIALPRHKVEEAIKTGQMSTDQIYRGAYSNRASGKAVYQKNSFESDEDYKKRTQKYAIDVGQARHNLVKSYNSQINAKKDLERAEKRMPNIKKVKDASSALVEAYSVWNNAKKDLAKAGDNGSASAALKKKVEDARKTIVDKSYDLNLALGYIGFYPDAFTADEIEAATKLRNAYNESTQTMGEYAAKKATKLFHDNLEHGWFTDLFKKSYNAKGSTAGMPTNLPRTATSGGSAGSKQLVYSDQLRKLNNNLVEYELKMNQAKASYEEYRKLYNDTKKNIANTEKALTEATKEAARTGFDPSRSSVAPPARRYASSNAILPQTTITGSTEGLKKTRYHVKKK